MSESLSHIRIKKKLAGKNGKVEVPLSGRRRLDAATKCRAYEIERSGRSSRLRKAALRLLDSGKKQKILTVPYQHMVKAKQAMKSVGVKGSIKNMGGTKRISV